MTDNYANQKNPNNSEHSGKHANTHNPNNQGYTGSCAPAPACAQGGPSPAQAAANNYSNQMNPNNSNYQGGKK